MIRTLPRRRGFALADFLAGSIIFSGTLSLFVAMTHAKFSTLEAADLRSRAEAALEVELDRVRLEGPGGAPTGEADADGFRLVRTFEPQMPGLAAPRLPAGRGEVALRALRVDGAPNHQLFEARVTVSWVDRPGDPGSGMRVCGSTVVAREEPQ